jgi:hypothetical protein
MQRIDRTLRAWHVWGLCILACSWFGGLVAAGSRAMPDITMSRCPIGMCLTGYPPDLAREFFGALGAKGSAALVRLLSPFDFVTPVLLVLALAAVLVYTTRPRDMGGHMPLTTGWRLTLVALPLLYGFADYGENVVVLRMLGSSDRITDALAHRGSILTAAKSQLIVASIAFAGVFVVLAWLERRRK